MPSRASRPWGESGRPFADSSAAPSSRRCGSTRSRSRARPSTSRREHGPDGREGMTGAPEHWICGSCPSPNQPRAPRCYKCRTPRELVEADPATLVVAGVGTSDSSAAVTAAARAAVIGGYRSSAIHAVVAQALILATAAVAVVASLVGADAVALLLA